MSCKKLILGVAIVAAGLAGGSVAANDYPPAEPVEAASEYPPAEPPVTTVLASSQQNEVAQPEAPLAIQRPADLAETGADTGTVLKIAGGALVAGAGLLVATRRRRHPATS